jgi:hypothetical protein
VTWWSPDLVSVTVGCELLASLQKSIIQPAMISLGDIIGILAILLKTISEFLAASIRPKYPIKLSAFREARA